MVDLEVLARQARRVNEWGRLRAAGRVIAPVGLALGAAVAVGTPVEACAGFAAALFLIAAALRWWSRAGALAVRAGLTMGALPLAAGLVTTLVDATCASGPARVCGSLCVLLGLVGGVAAGRYVGTRGVADRFRHTLFAGVVASLTAAIGCVGLGAGGLLAVLGAVLAGAALAGPVRWGAAR